MTIDGHGQECRDQRPASRSIWHSIVGWPVLGVCGYGGVGKTALIEAVMPHLRRSGLDVGVIKHDVHGLELDHRGEDNARLFSAGADILRQGPGETRMRAQGGGDMSAVELDQLCHEHDVVLVEGHQGTPLPKVWLERKGETRPPQAAKNVIDVLPANIDRAERLQGLLDRWLPGRWTARPVCGCVLIGGGSRRMGRPKHLIEQDGKTWLERTVARLARFCSEVVIAGRGEVPAALIDCPRLPDVPGVNGPLAGMLAAMRWAPESSWLISACDMPDLSGAAIRWLLDSRVPGIWVTLPRISGRVEPLLAHYDPRAAVLLERLAAAGEYAPRALTGHAKVATPVPPSRIAGAWRNVNTAGALGSGGL